MNREIKKCHCACEGCQETEHCQSVECGLKNEGHHHYYCEECETKWAGNFKYCDNCESAKNVFIDEPIIQRPKKRITP